MKWKHYQQSVLQGMGKLYETLYKKNDLKGLSLIEEVLKIYKIHILNRGDGIILVSNMDGKIKHIRNIKKRGGLI